MSAYLIYKQLLPIQLPNMELGTRFQQEFFVVAADPVKARGFSIFGHKHFEPQEASSIFLSCPTAQQFLFV